MVTAVIDPTMVPGHPGASRFAMGSLIWQRFLVRVIGIAVFCGTYLGTFFAIRFAASLLGHDPETLGDMPFRVGLTVGLVASLAANLRFSASLTVDAEDGSSRSGTSVRAAPPARSPRARPASHPGSPTPHEA